MLKAIRNVVSYLKFHEAYVPLLLVAAYGYILGMTHQLLGRTFGHYRKMSARAFELESPVDLAFQVLDQLGKVAESHERRVAGTAKNLGGITFSPGVRVQNVGKRLHRANFAGARLWRSKFVSVNLERTQWVGATISGCTFSSCGLRDSNLAPADARGTAFSDCDLTGSTVAGDLASTTFVRCVLQDLHPNGASLASSRFHDCVFASSDLSDLDLSGAIFECCVLDNAILRGTCLRGATFIDCDLRGANFSEADITGLVVKQSRIYGMSLWSTKGEAAVAQNLSLAKEGEFDALEIDGLHIASFVSSLIEGNGVRDLVDGLSSSIVLVLGRFDPPHKAVLDGIRANLRKLGYSAVVFDTSVPTTRDATETVSILARLSRFVIADLTAPKSTPHELNQFVADCTTPVQVVTRGESAFSMSEDLEKYPWVSSPRRFDDGEALLQQLPSLVEDLEQVRAAARS